MTLHFLLQRSFSYADAEPVAPITSNKDVRPLRLYFFLVQVPTAITVSVRDTW